MELSSGLVSEFEKLKKAQEQRVEDEQLQAAAENPHDLMLFRHYAQADRAVAIASAVGMHRLFTGVSDLARDYYSEWVTIEEQADRVVQARITRTDHVSRTHSNIEVGLTGSSAGIDLRLMDPGGAFATAEDTGVVSFFPSAVSHNDVFGVRKKLPETYRYDQVDFDTDDWQEIDEILDKLQAGLKK
jgi:hypothetical protein